MVELGVAAMEAGHAVLNSAAVHAIEVVSAVVFLVLTYRRPTDREYVLPHRHRVVELEHEEIDEVEETEVTR